MDVTYYRGPGGYAWTEGHNHPTVERFGFVRREAPLHDYDVSDDEGDYIGIVRRTDSGWSAYANHTALLDANGHIRYRRRRQDAAYGLLCVAKGCATPRR